MIKLKKLLELIKEDCGACSSESEYAKKYPQWFMMDEGVRDPSNAEYNKIAAWAKKNGLKLDGLGVDRTTGWINYSATDAKGKTVTGVFKESEDIEHNSLSKEHQAALMVIYADDKTALDKIRPQVITDLQSKGYIDNKKTLTAKGQKLFEGTEVGFRDVVYPKNVDVIADSNIDPDTNALVTTYRLLVAYPNGVVEIVPESSLPGGTDAEDLMDKTASSDFFDNYYLPAIMKNFNIEKLD